MKSFFRQYIKRNAQRITSNKNLPALIVSSMGRSGSTVVYNAATSTYLNNSPLRNFSYGERLTADWSWNLNEKPLIPGTIYKTHDYPNKIETITDIKAIFLFGSSLDAACSVYSSWERFGEKWVKNHFEHLNASGEFSDIFAYDVLRFEEQIKSWAVEDRFPVLCIRYEKLWENQSAISDFLDLPFYLPTKRQRVAVAIEPEKREQLSSIFTPLDIKLSKIPDMFIGSSTASEYFK